MSRTTGRSSPRPKRRTSTAVPFGDRPAPVGIVVSGLFVLIPVDFDEAGSAILVLVVDHEASVIG